jgi:BA14K-like protein
MMLKKLTRCLLAAAIGVGALPLVVDASYAKTSRVTKSDHTSDQWKEDGSNFERRRHRSQRFSHYHRGYYYAAPWWIEAPVAVATVPFRFLGAVLGVGDVRLRSHVGWCMDRYRSYDPDDNTWVSRSGRVRQCVSPYR